MNIAKRKIFSLTLLAFCALLLFAKCFYFDIAVVRGNSMYPTLCDGDLLSVKKHGYSVKANDIVLVSVALEPNREGYAVKRVIATGGDIVSLDYDLNAIYVNGHIIHEPYINYDQNDPMLQNGTENTDCFRVPENHVFLLGDNRNHSMDSRDDEIGMVAETAIIGVVSIFLQAYPGGT